MRIRKWLLLLTSALVAAALIAAGCNKVRDPQVPEKPGPAGPATDTQKAPDQKPEGPPPVIGCDKPEHNFGTVAQGEQAVHIFTVKNTGKGVLKIERARGG